MIVIQENFIVKLSPCPANVAYHVGKQQILLLSMGRPRKFRQGGEEVSLVVNVFHRRLYEPPLRSNWTQWVEGGPLVIFRGWGDPLPPHSGSTKAKGKLYMSAVPQHPHCWYIQSIKRWWVKN